MRHVLTLAVVAAVAAPAASAPSKSPWQVLVKKGASWTLKLTSEPNAASPAPMRVTVEDVRKVGGADVVRLAYACGADGDPCSNPLLVHQLAIAATGVYAVDRPGNDAEIAKALKAAPLVGDTPRKVDASKHTGGAFVLVPVKQRKDTVCIGQIDLPDEDGVGCGASPCAGWVCLDATGVVGAGDVGDSGAQYGFVPESIPE
jgi:hypothetical protein